MNCRSQLAKFFAQEASKCDYAIAGNTLSDTDVCGSRVDCEIACAEFDACVAFEYVPRTYVCTLFSTCSPEAKPGSVVVTKAAAAKCKTEVTGALLPPSLSATCKYDTDAFAMTSCGLDGEYFEVSSTEYRTASNRSRIVADSAQPCLGWVLEANTADAEMVKAFTFFSAPQDVVDLHFSVAYYGLIAGEYCEHCAAGRVSAATAGDDATVGHHGHALHIALMPCHHHIAFKFGAILSKGWAAARGGA